MKSGIRSVRTTLQLHAGGALGTAVSPMFSMTTCAHGHPVSAPQARELMGDDGTHD